MPDPQKQKDRNILFIAGFGLLMVVLSPFYRLWSKLRNSGRSFVHYLRDAFRP